MTTRSRFRTLTGLIGCDGLSRAMIREAFRRLHASRMAASACGSVGSYLANFTKSASGSKALIRCRVVSGEIVLAQIAQNFRGRPLRDGEMIFRADKFTHFTSDNRKYG